MVEDGSTAPNFTLRADDGIPIEIGGSSDDIVVLFFYPKDDTSGCTKEAKEFSQALAEFEDAGARVFGISPDSVESHIKFKAKHGLTVTLLADQDRAAIEAYGLWVEKKMYGKTYMGVERSTFIVGRDGLIARSWRKVKVPGHVQAVLQAVRDLG